ncbi:MAG: hypothetical protein KF852_17445 [Saprospiraceae bacterium]|nr:hypothetical protein [Saprospiraceae bacterium]
MKISTLSTIWAIAYFGFGIGLLLIPVQFMATYGISPDINGALMSRILGAALIAFALTFWLNRHIPASDKAWHNLLFTSTIYNVLDIPIVLLATLNGVMNAMGWIPVGLHVFLAVTMGYFAFLNPNREK